MTSPAANYIGPVFVFHPKVIKFKGLVVLNKRKKAYGVTKCKMNQLLAKILFFFSKPMPITFCHEVSKSILLRFTKRKKRNYKRLLVYWLLLTL